LIATDWKGAFIILIRKEKRHFNMIELLKAEEQKKQGGIGVAKTARLPNAAPQVRLVM
jgi:hypothetical protein